MPDPVQGFYDKLAGKYHLMFDDWPAAIARQAAVIGPRLEQAVGQASRRLKIADCACGIGTQAIGLAQRGHNVTGSDLSPAAIERARREALSAKLDIGFQVADIFDLAPIQETNFDAVVCLDNALPHLDSFERLCQAAAECRRILRPGGVFLASIRDYDRLIHERPAIQQPCFYGNGPQRRIIHQVWDWMDDLRYTVHLYITVQDKEGWQVHHYATICRALLRHELVSALQSAGFTAVDWIFPSESGYYQPMVIARSGPLTTGA